MHRLTNLLGLYCEAMDAGDFDAVGQLFARGELCDEHGTTIAAGSDAVTAFYRDSVQLHEGLPRTKHLVMNMVVDLDDADTDADAEIRSSYLVLQGLDGEVSPMICGSYRDSFARDGATGWHFVRRQFHVDLMGDLSRHLNFAV